MDSSTSPDSQPRAFIRPAAWGWPLAALGFLLYVLVLARFMGAYAGGSDSSGYLNNARLLSEGRLIAPMRLVPSLPPDTLPSYTHVPLGFIPNPDHVTLTPTYPMGLPLLIMAVSEIAGWAAGPALVMALQALLGLWLVYLLGREVGLEAGWAWLGALLLAVNPLYLAMGLQVMSDVPALVWVTTAVLCAWQSRRRTWFAWVAGTALAVAVLVRPSNLLAFIPVAIALGFALRRWLLLILGGLPGAVFLGVLNYSAYHRVFTTGYGDVGSQFSATYVPATLLHYLLWLPALLTPLILLAAGVPLLWRRRPLPAVLLTIWVLVFGVFYLFYEHTHEAWWYIRFLLPAFPPLIVGALLVARTLAERFRIPVRAWWLAPAAAVAFVYCYEWSRYLSALSTGKGERVYPETTTWTRAHLPANAVVATMQTSGALFFYTDNAILRWDMMDAEVFPRIAHACRAAGRPIYAVLFPYEIDELNAFKQHLPGSWTRIGEVRQVTIWRFDSPTAP